MDWNEFLSAIKDEDYIGLNEAATDAQIALVNVKLRQNGFPELPQDFIQVLKMYNGLSYDGNVIFGINTDNNFFPDLLDFNLKVINGKNSNSLILGRDEEFLLVWQAQNQSYSIVDADDFSEHRLAPDLFWAILWILKI